MRPEMGPPETTLWEYPGEDVSWRAEWRHFLDAVGGKMAPWGSLEDALAVLHLVDRVYAQEPAAP
jgi:predicted dehydrogenase